MQFIHAIRRQCWVSESFPLHQPHPIQVTPVSISRIVITKNICRKYIPAVEILKLENSIDGGWNLLKWKGSIFRNQKHSWLHTGPVVGHLGEQPVHSTVVVAAGAAHTIHIVPTATLQLSTCKTTTHSYSQELCQFIDCSRLEPIRKGTEIMKKRKLYTNNT